MKTDPLEKAAKAKQLLRFLADSEPIEEDVQSSFLKTYVTFIRDHLVPKDDAFLIHDELSENNQPFYFHEFAQMAASHGLQYLGEADFSYHDGYRPAAGGRRWLARGWRRILFRPSNTWILCVTELFAARCSVIKKSICHALYGPEVVNDLYVGAASVPMDRGGDPTVQSAEAVQGIRRGCIYHRPPRHESRLAFPVPNLATMPSFLRAGSGMPGAGWMEGGWSLLKK